MTFGPNFKFGFSSKKTDSSLKAFYANKYSSQVSSQATSNGTTSHSDYFTKAEHESIGDTSRRSLLGNQVFPFGPRNPLEFVVHSCAKDGLVYTIQVKFDTEPNLVMFRSIFDVYQLHTSIMSEYPHLLNPRKLPFLDKPNDCNFQLAIQCGKNIEYYLNHLIKMPFEFEQLLNRFLMPVQNDYEISKQDSILLLKISRKIDHGYKFKVHGVDRTVGWREPDYITIHDLKQRLFDLLDETCDISYRNEFSEMVPLRTDHELILLMNGKQVVELFTVPKS